MTYHAATTQHIVKATDKVGESERSQCRAFEWKFETSDIFFNSIAPRASTFQHIHTTTQSSRKSRVLAIMQIDGVLTVTAISSTKLYLGEVSTIF